jgi:hypothetical protein
MCQDKARKRYGPKAIINSYDDIIMVFTNWT